MAPFAPPLVAFAPPPVPPPRSTSVPDPVAAGDASDEDLMRAYVAGDRAAFQVLFRRLAPRLHGFFHRAFRSTAVADDLLQTTFLKIHAARHGYDGVSTLRPWVFTIAARVRADELRRRYRLPRLATDDGTLDALPSEAHDAGDVLEADQRAARIRRAVDALPEGQRVVLHLHRFEGLTFAEVAQVLELREGAVRVRAFRAYERLREALGDLLGAPGLGLDDPPPGQGAVAPDAREATS